MTPSDRAPAAMPPAAATRSFSQYNAAQRGRPVRRLALRGAELAGPAAGRTAVELGSGIGIEAAHLAGLGWEVRSYDADPSVEEPMRELAARAPVTHRTVSLEDPGLVLPPCHLLLSCATLPFTRREAFPDLWRRIREAVQPGGVLALDLFGDRDGWAGHEGTFLSRTEVEELLDGLDVLDLEEREHEGRSFAGPKHWHVLTVLARA
ncbi:class I SAM-dependent methyltransferase [Brachybacterium hainanense]|uniref:Class I SAM-dependent methyltransferase n=1 Tax=Brachybacterium hainanense TaxID=1541174 RepID=A0ABV6RGP6_9MICO